MGESMLTRPCARLPDIVLYCVARSFQLSFALLFCFSFLLFATLVPSPVQADETIITAVTLNQQKKGTLFVVMRDDGDFLLLPADLEQMGLRQLPAERVVIDGEAYISLQALQDVSFAFDDQSLILAITAAAELLPGQSVSLAYARQGSVYYPRESSLFVNYGLAYNTGGDSALDFQNFNVSNEVGWRLGDVLLISDAVYTETREEEQLVRLNSRLIWDQRDSLHRLVAGDLTAVSGDLGSRLPMGGLSFSKVYQLDPYFIRYPLFDFSGLVNLPSEVELYVDGVKVRTERFAPGEFELLNFQGIRGAQNIEVVVRDAFGREQSITSAIYATDQILSRGLHEYSYNAGFQRRNFGYSSNDYEHDPAFTAFHRYGLTDWFNLGGSTELSEDLVNLGLQTKLVAGPYGLLKLDGAGSFTAGESGAAGQLTYEYQTRRFNARLGVQAYSTDYRTLGDLDTAVDRKLNLVASAGYLTARLGSFGVRYLEAQQHEQPSRRELTLSWSRQLIQRADLNASLSWIDEDRGYAEGSLTLTWRFGRDHAITASHRHERDRDAQSLEVRKNIPYGYGTGWSLEGERIEAGSTTSERANGYLQHNASHAILRGDFGHTQNDFDTDTSTRLSLSGALVQVGGRFGLTRPVRDSFTLVTVGEAEDVLVYVNGQNSGWTNRNGQLFVPDLSSYYENRVSFEDKDIPLDYLMPQVKLSVSPPLRSGSCVNFPLKRYQAFTGTLHVDEQGEKAPLRDAELILQFPAGPVTFWTDSRGEFYLDSQMDVIDILAVQGCGAAYGSPTLLPPGTYPLTVKQNGRTFQSRLSLPESVETFTDLGAIDLTSILASTAPPRSPPAVSAPEPSLTGVDDPAAPRPTAETTAEPAFEMAAKTAVRFVIHFPFDQSVPKGEDLPTLAAAVAYLHAHPELPAEIAGHASKEGDAGYNQQLGLRRALAIQEHLVAAGIAAQRIVGVHSFGKDQPVCRGEEPACLAQNRRVVLGVAESP